MNVITPHSVTISDPSLPVYFDGNPIPSSRVINAWFDGANPAEIVNLGLQAAIYRTETRPQLLVVHQLDDTDVSLGIVHDSFDNPCHIVLREEPTVTRPMFRPSHGMLARFVGMSPTPDMMRGFLAVARQQGYEVASWRERRGDLVPIGQAHLYLRLLRVSTYHANAHQLVRAKVITGRPGGHSLRLSYASSSRFPAHANDGTVCITPSVERPWQGTLQGDDQEFIKGIIRPPLCINGNTEAPAVCEDAAFGHTLTSNQGTFHILSHLPDSPRSTHANLQAILFAAADPAAVIDADTQRIERKTKDPLAVLSSQSRRKVAAGVPRALFFDEFAPWNWLKQIEVHGVRATVFASDLVPVGHVSFLPLTWRRVRQKVGDVITLHRDPALPNGTSMHDFTIYEPAEWQSEFDGAGIVLNPQDSEWAAMGGDFDGDQAMAFKRKFTLAPKAPVQHTYLREDDQPLALEDGEPSITATVIEVLADSFSSSLGQVVTAAQRLAERGELTPELRTTTADLAQAAVSAQKHSIDAEGAREAFAVVQQHLKDLTPPKGFLVDKLRNVTASGGRAEIQKAWNALNREPIEAFKDDPAPVAAALYRRTVALDNLLREIDYIRRGSAALPKHLKDRANELLVKEVGLHKAYAQKSRVERWNREWTMLRRKSRDVQRGFHDPNGDHAETAAANELYQQEHAAKRVELRMWLKDGYVTENALIAHGANYPVAMVVKASTFEALGATVVEVRTGIRKAPGAEYRLGEDVKLPAQDLWPLLFTADRARDTPLLTLEPDHEVTIRPFKDNTKSMQVMAYF